MSGILNDAMRFRVSRPTLDARWVDVRYADLVNEPMAVDREIYARFNWSLDPMAFDEMQQWLTLQQRQRRQEPRHKYGLEDDGITPEGVTDAFALYLDFADTRECL